jgi:ecotin
MTTKTGFTQLLAIILALLSFFTYAAEHSELKAFPPPQDGMDRFVIVLPHKERGEEEAFGVELIVGREMLTDGVNLVRLGNTIEPRPLQGWGYTYYEVTGPSATMSTLMAPPPGAPQVKKFVTAAPLRINYNSRLPVVVYVPRGYEVRYRIWEASETMHRAEKG